MLPRYLKNLNKCKSFENDKDVIKLYGLENEKKLG